MLEGDENILTEENLQIIKQLIPKHNEVGRLLSTKTEDLNLSKTELYLIELARFENLEEIVEFYVLYRDLSFYSKTLKSI